MMAGVLPYVDHRPQILEVLDQTAAMGILSWAKADALLATLQSVSRFDLYQVQVGRVNAYLHQGFLTRGPIAMIFSEAAAKTKVSLLGLGVRASAPFFLFPHELKVYWLQRFHSLHGVFQSAASCRRV